MKSTYKFIFIITLTFIVQNALKAQGWIISEADNSITLVGEGCIKSIDNDEEGNETVSIYNFKKGMVIMIDDDNATYAQCSWDEYCAIMKSVRDEMNQQMPADQQKMMQDMINQEKAKPAPKISITKSPGNEIAGYQTTKYSINVDGELFEEKWITNDAALNSILSNLKKAEDIANKTVSCFLPEGWPIKNSPEFSDEYRNVSNAGIEMKSVRYEYGSAQTETDVISLEKEDISDSEFEAPSDYEKVSFKELMMSMSGM